MAERILAQEPAAHPADLTPEVYRLRSHLIGAVALLCRVYSRLSPDARGELEEEGSMERLARDFNSDTYALEMARAFEGWGLFGRAARTPVQEVDRG